MNRISIVLPKLGKVSGVARQQLRCQFAMLHTFRGGPTALSAALRHHAPLGAGPTTPSPVSVAALFHSSSERGTRKVVVVTKQRNAPQGEETEVTEAPEAARTRVQYDQKYAPLLMQGRGTLVYYGKLTSRTRNVKVVNYALSTVYLFMSVPMLKFGNLPNLQAKISTGALLGFLAVFFPLALHFVTRKYVTRMYYDENTNTFTASTFGLLRRDVTYKFTPDDVELLHKPVASVKVNGKHELLIDRENFFQPEIYYKKMLKWDQEDEKYNEFVRQKEEIEAKEKDERGEEAKEQQKVVEEGTKSQK